MEEEFEEAQPQKISLYNSGMAQIQRLGELLTDTHKHARAGKLTNWNWDLDRVWMELVGNLDDDDDRIEKFEEFTITVGNLNKSLINKQIKSEEYRQQMYQLLMDKERFLRRLVEKLGKGSKLVDADEDMID